MGDLERAGTTVVLPVGPSAVEGLAAFCAAHDERDLADLLRSVSGQAARPEGLTDGDLVAAVDRWLDAGTAPADVAELRAIDLFHGPVLRVHLVALDGPLHQLAATILTRLLPKDLPSARVTVPDVAAAADPAAAATDLVSLLKVAMCGASPVGSTSVVVLADPPASVVPLLTMAAERAEAGIRLLGPDRLVPLTEPSVATDAAGVALARLGDWAYLPHAVRLREAGRWDELDVRTAARMRSRTATWVEGDVWQGDRLPHMVHHGKDHGRRVDQLATDLLRLSPFFDGLTGPSRGAAVEALSAAAWLHDLGQQGGPLEGERISDYRHLRRFHGLLSRELIDRDATALDLKDDDLRDLVGRLAKSHQRVAKLDKEKPKDFEFCATGCRLCQAASNLLNSSLVFELERLDPSHRVVEPEHAAMLAAILRVADASDIGVHRVNGRWRAGTLGIEQAWRADYLEQAVARRRLAPDVRRHVDQMLTAARWEETTLATLEALVAGGPDVTLAEEVRGFDGYLLEQREHVAKHHLLAGTSIVQADDGFTIQMDPGPAWSTASGEVAGAAKTQVFTYIWGEYLQSESQFATGGLPRLRAVVGPDGDRCVHGKGARLNGR